MREIVLYEKEATRSTLIIKVNGHMTLFPSASAVVISGSLQNSILFVDFGSVKVLLNRKTNSP